MSAIDDAITQLKKGELDKAIKPSGNPVQHKTLAELEELRLKMRESRNLAIENAKSIKDMLAAATHDMKTPLAVIQGYAECIEDGIDDKNYPALIREKAGQMNDLVLSILDGIKQEENDMPFFTKVDACAYLRSEFLRHKVLASSKRIKYKVGFCPHAFTYVDLKEMPRVISNIVSNAVKYTPEKGKIKVRFFAHGKTLSISVKNTGQGIDKENIPFIFERFYMEDASRTASAGSGLGLYVVKTVMEKQNGSVAVRSKKGKYAKFIIRLPIEKVKKTKNPPAGV